MKPLTLQQVAEWTDGRVTGDRAARVRRVSTDSREDLTGALFVALVGERHDAHRFVGQAFGNGAVAAIVSRVDGRADRPVVVVRDTLEALQALATRYRAALDPFVSIGITGSNGKTSTKDFLASVLARKFRVHATRGNLNNHIGVPLTVLGVGAEHTAGVFELGINHFGELAPLVAIAQPHLGVITNIGTAHIEFLGSREGIAHEKGVLAEAIGPAGCVVLNANDGMTASIAARTQARVLTAGLETGDVRAERIERSSFDLVSEPFGMPRGAFRVSLRVPGRHMIQNAVLAAATGLQLGLAPADVHAGLESAQLHSGRLERREAGGLWFLDDSYNANPDSMRAALRTLMEQPVSGRHLAVLGRMAELGSHSTDAHRAVGKAARDERVGFLLTVGDDESRLIHEAFDDDGRSRHFASHADAAAWLREHATRDDLVLVKGSRSAAMERIIQLLAPEPPVLAHP
jgi:UDP-N-acetylmuramoyl-tripeptide--D-alanyl-D-alanine ligase